MADFLLHLSFWDWLALGSALLILEIFGAGGYLLWLGIAAAAVGVLTFIMPSLVGALQWVLFALLSLATAAYWWQRQRSAVRPSDQPGLNMRGQELIGRTVVVTDAIVGGRGKVRVGDGVWLARGPDAVAGTTVKVSGLDGTVLLVALLGAGN